MCVCVCLRGCLRLCLGDWGGCSVSSSRESECLHCLPVGKNAHAIAVLFAVAVAVGVVIGNIGRWHGYIDPREDHAGD